MSDRQVSVHSADVQIRIASPARPFRFPSYSTRTSRFSFLISFAFSLATFSSFPRAKLSFTRSRRG